MVESEKKMENGNGSELLIYSEKYSYPIPSPEGIKILTGRQLGDYRLQTKRANWMILLAIMYFSSEGTYMSDC